jgi:superoxide dismutase, Cu-Zn family
MASLHGRYRSCPFLLGPAVRNHALGLDIVMKRMICALAAAALLGTPVAAEVLGIGNKTAKAIILDRDGVPIGMAKLTQSKKRGLQVAVAVRGLTRGERGVHLHLVGRCEGPAFASAGLHWNPDSRAHGLSNPDGSHHGDLPNLLVKRNGKGKLRYDIADAQLKGKGGLMDDDGAAIVIHAKSDDQRTDPSGNSGDRIACGVLLRD